MSRESGELVMSRGSGAGSQKLRAGIIVTHCFSSFLLTPGSQLLTHRELPTLPRFPYFRNL